MKIQGYDIFPLICEHFWLDGGAMFGTVPKVMWERKHPSDDKNRIELVTRSILIIGHGRIIVVDTGIGEVWDEKFKSIYKVSDWQLLRELKKHGVEPEQVTDVVITHLHFDHIGGAIQKHGQQIRLTFPNADHHIQKTNYDLAMNPNPREKASYLKSHIQPVAQAGRFVFHNGNTELFEGLTLHESNAHTKGQQWLTLTDNNQTVCYPADVIPTASHVRLPWVMGYDLYPLELMEEKKALLNRAVKENWILCFEHDPMVEAATLVLTDKGIAVDGAVKLG
jgi:glyoxylase-like metal-dependent hydrolase (beta-lactamase superfamily II)